MKQGISSTILNPDDILLIFICSLDIESEDMKYGCFIKWIKYWTNENIHKYYST